MICLFRARAEYKKRWTKVATGTVVTIITLILAGISGLKDFLDLVIEYIFVFPSSETSKSHLFVVFGISFSFLVILIISFLILICWKRYKKIALISIVAVSLSIICILIFPESRRFVSIGFGLPPNRARDGQTMIVIAEFEDKSASRVSGFDLTGRIYREITDKIGSENPNFPVEYYRKPLMTVQEAKLLASQLKATVIIWGSFDAAGGRLYLTLNSPLVSPFICTVRDFEYSQAEFETVELAFTKDLPTFSTYISLLSLGLIQYHKGFDDTAIDFLSQALSVAGAKDNSIQIADGLFYRAALYMRRNQIDLALADLEGIFPKDANVYYGIGNIYLEKKDYNKSIENLSLALEKEKTYCALDHRAISYIENGDYGAAANDYQLATSLFPFRAGAYCNLGIAYHNLGQFSDAITSLEKGIDLYRKHGEDRPGDLERCQATLEEYRQNPVHP